MRFIGPGRCPRIIAISAACAWGSQLNAYPPVEDTTLGFGGANRKGPGAEALISLLGKLELLIELPLRELSLRLEDSVSHCSLFCRRVSVLWDSQGPRAPTLASPTSTNENPARMSSSALRGSRPASSPTLRSSLLFLRCSSFLSRTGLANWSSYVPVSPPHSSAADAPVSSVNADADVGVINGALLRRETCLSPAPPNHVDAPASPPKTGLRTDPGLSEPREIAVVERHRPIDKELVNSCPSRLPLGFPSLSLSSRIASARASIVTGTATSPDGLFGFRLKVDSRRSLMLRALVSREATPQTLRWGSCGCGCDCDCDCGGGVAVSGDAGESGGDLFGLGCNLAST